MARPKTKDRVTFTIDSKIIKDFERLTKALNVSKSFFIENILKESIEASSSLFSTNDTLASAVVMLSKELNEVKKFISERDLNEGRNSSDLLSKGC